MAKGARKRHSASDSDTKTELHDIERRLRAHPANGSNDVLALLTCIFVIVASVAGLPLGIIGVTAIARQSGRRRKLLQRALIQQLDDFDPRAG